MCLRWVLQHVARGKERSVHCGPRSDGTLIFLVLGQGEGATWRTVLGATKRAQCAVSLSQHRPERTCVRLRIILLSLTCITLVVFDLCFSRRIRTGFAEKDWKRGVDEWTSGRRVLCLSNHFFIFTPKLLGRVTGKRKRNLAPLSWCSFCGAGFANNKIS